MTSSLRGRVALATGALVAAAVLLVSATAVAGFDRSEREELDARLAERAEEAGAMAARGTGRGIGPGASSRRDDQHGDPAAGLGPFGRLVDTGPELLRIIDGGTVIAEVGTDRGVALPPATVPGFRDLVDADDRTWRSYATSTADAVLVQAAAPVAPLDARVRSLRQQAALIGAAAVVLAAAVTWWLAGVALRPLTALRATAERVASTHDLSERVNLAPDAPVEIATVAGSLDAMLARLEVATADTQAALDSARRFAADAGHELRTPLSGMGTNLDALARNPDLDPAERQGVLDALTAEQRRLVTRLDALQALARADARASATEHVDLAEVAESAADAARTSARPIAATVEGDERLLVTGSPEGMRTVLDNLLANAATHGARRVRVTVGRHGEEALLLVDDDGPGIAPPDRARMLQPFVRGHAARTDGSGLGLAIVSGVVRAHGGTVALEDSPLGGLRVRLRFPGPG